MDRGDQGGQAVVERDDIIPSSGRGQLEGQTVCRELCRDMGEVGMRSGFRQRARQDPLVGDRDDVPLAGRPEAPHEVAVRHRST